MLPKQGKLDPRVKRTRKLLVEAFKALMNEKPLQAITVQDITARAEVNRATFYAHFDDKYALHDHLIRVTFRETIQSSLLDTCQFSIENLRLLIVAVCEFLGQVNGGCHPSDAQFRPLIEAQIQGQLYELLLHWLDEEQPQVLSAKPEIAATILSWSIFGVGLQWSKSKERQPAEQLANEVVLLLMAGSVSAGQAVAHSS